MLGNKGNMRLMYHTLRKDRSRTLCCDAQIGIEPLTMQALIFAFMLSST